MKWTRQAAVRHRGDARDARDARDGFSEKALMTGRCRQWASRLKRTRTPRAIIGTPPDVTGGFDLHVRENKRSRLVFSFYPEM